MQNFKNKTSKILVVTDVAARGLDIPLLENVINFDIPTIGKLYIHRAGRTARAGNSGSCWTILT
jgi:ATP-dependent RNA helicase DDX54/DBP10